MRRLTFILILLLSANCFALQKNVASQKWVVFAFDRTDNTAKTGDAAQITADVYIDGVVNAVDDANPTELAHGYYVFDITAAESNGDSISIDPVSSTGNIQVVGCPMALWTTPPAFPALTKEVIADQVWDEVVTAHAVASSAGLYLTSLYQTLVTRVAQCGDAGGASTIDLDAAASAVADFYKGQLIAVVAGTGIGQSRTCTTYDGATKIATVHPPWATPPDGDSWFAILNTGSTVVVDWVDGGRLDLILDIIAADTTTDIPALIATAQADLDTITGTAGALIATDAQDLSATLSVNTKTITAGAINAAAIATDAIDADAVKADAWTELLAVPFVDIAAGAPPYNASWFTGMNYLYEAWRNQTWSTATEITIYKNDAATPLVESTISDDATTFKREEMRAPD